MLPAEVDLAASRLSVTLPSAGENEPTGKNQSRSPAGDAAAAAAAAAAVRRSYPGE